MNCNAIADMSLSVPYAVNLCQQLSPLGLKWMEEYLMPGMQTQRQQNECSTIGTRHMHGRESSHVASLLESNALN